MPVIRICVINEDPWGLVQNFHWYQAAPFIRQYGSLPARVRTERHPDHSEYMIAQSIKPYLEVSEATSKHMLSASGLQCHRADRHHGDPQQPADALRRIHRRFRMGNLDITTMPSGRICAQLDAIGLQDVLKIVQNVYDACTNNARNVTKDYVSVSDPAYDMRFQ